MLLIWHGTWRRHIYEEDITDVIDVEDDFYWLFMYPPIYELEPSLYRLLIILPSVVSILRAMLL